MVFLKHFIFSRLQQTQLICRKYNVHNMNPLRNLRIPEFRKKYGELLLKPDIPEETWKEIKKDMQETSRIPKLAIDGTILNLCKTNELMHAGVQYYKLLESHGKPSIIITGEYLRLYEYKDGPLNDIEKEHIWKLYKHISENYKLIHSDLTTACVVALAKLGDAEECIEVMDQFEKCGTGEFLYKAHEVLIICLLKQGKLDLAYKYLINSFTKSNGPSVPVYKAFVEYCEKNENDFDANVENMFKLWKKHGIIASQEIVQVFMDACNEHGWSAIDSKLNRSICTRCTMDIIESDMTDIEYQTLKENIMEKLIIGRGYMITMPREWTNFTKFLDTNGPYDVVIDSLNVLYTRINKVKRFNVDSLTNVLNHVQKLKKKALVIGKAHLRKYSVEKNYKSRIDFYFVNDISKDDEFALYATVANGKDTILISNDFMRQHKFLLENVKLGAIFKKWQHTHQYTWGLIRDKVVLSPLSGSQRDLRHCINSGVQKTGIYWHIPHSTVLHTFNQPTYTQWTCFRMPIDLSKCK
ncbi:mitochondrial ribonuclease P catalytic subunit [Augochlora pura]